MAGRGRPVRGMLPGFSSQGECVSARQALVAGNWKLNGTRASADSLAHAIVDGVRNAGMTCECLVCPVFVHLDIVRNAISDSALMLGAQNCSSEDSGAFTGEVSAPMLADVGCTHVIVGHSERRALFGETSAQVADKAMAVQRAGMTPIFCVGETLDEREADQVEAVVGEQLDALLEGHGVKAFDRLVVAYEPVWAIGTGKTASPEEAQAVHHLIRARVAARDAAIAAKLRILYGGSVKPDNAAVLFGQPDIDGGLIGGAALDADSFLSICQAAG